MAVQITPFPLLENTLGDRSLSDQFTILQSTDAKMHQFRGDDDDEGIPKLRATPMGNFGHLLAASPLHYQPAFNEDPFGTPSLQQPEPT